MTLLEKAMMRPPAGTCCAAPPNTKKVPRKLVAITLSKVSTLPPEIGSRGNDSGRVHNHVDPAKDFERLFKKILNIRCFRHVRLHGDGLAAGAVNFAYD